MLEGERERRVESGRTELFPLMTLYPIVELGREGVLTERLRGLW